MTVAPFLLFQTFCERERRPHLVTFFGSKNALIATLTNSALLINLTQIINFSCCFSCFKMSPTFKMPFLFQNVSYLAHNFNKLCFLTRPHLIYGDLNFSIALKYKLLGKHQNLDDSSFVSVWSSDQFCHNSSAVESGSWCPFEVLWSQTLARKSQ